MGPSESQEHRKLLEKVNNTLLINFYQSRRNPYEPKTSTKNNTPNRHLGRGD